MVVAPILSILLQGTARVYQHAAAAGRRAARACRCACRLRHGQILWRHLSRAAEGIRPATRPRRRICRTPRTSRGLPLGCVLLGFFPTTVISMLSIVTQQLKLGGLPAERRALVAASADPRATVVLRTAGVLCGHLGRGGVGHRRVCGSSITSEFVRAPAWDCGFGGLNSRMQDTAEGFGQPIRHLFQPLFAIIRELPSSIRQETEVPVGDRRSILARFV